MNRLSYLLATIACLIATSVHATPPTMTRATARANALKKNLESFQLQLSYHGPQDKPYYSPTLSVLPVPQLATNPFGPIVQIKEDEAKRIIDHLAKDGFLDQATDPRLEKRRPLTTPGYLLSVKGQDVSLHAELGWDLAMLKRLDDLHAVLVGRAAKSMGLLITRLSGHRRQWQNQAQTRKTSE